MATDQLLETKEKVLAAAGPIFAAKGFKETTVREICQAAGVNIAAVNYYFGDKERLYIESIKRAHLSRLEQVPLPGWTARTTPEERLHDIIRTLLERMLENPADEWHAQLMLREMLHPTGACDELVQDYIRRQFDLLLAVLGQLLPETTPASERRLIAFSIVGQCLYHRIARPVVGRLVPAEEFRHYDPEFLAKHIAGFSLAAIGRAAGGGT